MPEIHGEMTRFLKELLEEDQVQTVGMKKDEDLFVKLYEKFHKGKILKEKGGK